MSGAIASANGTRGWKIPRSAVAKAAADELDVPLYRSIGGANAHVDYDLKGWVWTLGGTWAMQVGPAATLDLLAAVQADWARSVSVPGTSCGNPREGTALDDFLS